MNDKKDHREERYIEFDIEGFKFAFPLIFVKEVLPYQKSNRVPNTNNYCEGVINLRGNVISVIDLRMLMGYTKNNKNLELSIIILEVDKKNLGFVVDNIDRVFLASKSSNLAEKSDSKTQNSEFVSGMFRSNDCLITLLNVEKLCNIKVQNA